MLFPALPSPPCPPPAGVPVVRPVAGIAMGLVLEPDGRFAVLSDILGSEDALGDMDFKVAGDNDAVTAFQMDIKVGRTPHSVGGGGQPGEAGPARAQTVEG